MILLGFLIDRATRPARELLTRLCLRPMPLHLLMRLRDEAVYGPHRGDGWARNALLRAIGDERKRRGLPAS